MERSGRAIAERIARHLVASVPSVQAVCLFGSVSRGTDTRSSDIDLLVIGSSHLLTPRRLLNKLPSRLREAKLSLLYYPTGALARLHHQNLAFLDHIRREGTILYDPHGTLSRLLAQSAMARID